MSFNTASTSLRTLSLSCGASSSRCFSSSPAILAGGKGPKKSVVQQAGKKKSIGFSGKSSKGRSFMGPATRGIKLSYSMASPPPDLNDLATYAPSLVSAEHIGTPTKFNRLAVQGLDAFGLPRAMAKESATAAGQATVIRQCTVDVSSLLEKEAEGSSQDSRYMLAGDIGSGKSVLLAQSVAQAISKGWIVIYAPKAQTWIDSSAAYAYNSKAQIFDQPTIATSILNSMIAVNGAKLKQIEMEGTDLLEFAKNALRDERTASTSLGQVFDVLAKQTKTPVLLAIDEVNALFSKSSYRSPEFELLEAYHLSTPRLALDYLSGRKTFNRGMTLSAYSHSAPNLPLTTSFNYALELPTTEPITPYSKFEPVHLAHASSGFKKIEVPFGMSSKEAAGMFSIYAKKGWVRQNSDEVFLGAYMAAAGNPKELGREWLGDRKAYERFDTSTIV